jgi:hypothetical protein
MSSGRAGDPNNIMMVHACTGRPPAGHQLRVNWWCTCASSTSSRLAPAPQLAEEAHHQRALLLIRLIRSRGPRPQAGLRTSGQRPSPLQMKGRKPAGGHAGVGRGSPAAAGGPGCPKACAASRFAGNLLARLGLGEWPRGATRVMCVACLLVNAAARTASCTRAEPMPDVAPIPHACTPPLIRPVDT